MGIVLALGVAVAAQWVGLPFWLGIFISVVAGSTALVLIKKTATPFTGLQIAAAAGLVLFAMVLPLTPLRFLIAAFGVFVLFSFVQAGLPYIVRVRFLGFFTGFLWASAFFAVVSLFHVGILWVSIAAMVIVIWHVARFSLFAEDALAARAQDERRRMVSGGIAALLSSELLFLLLFLPHAPEVRAVLWVATFWGILESMAAVYASPLLLGKIARAAAMVAAAWGIVFFTAPWPPGIFS